MNGQEEHVRRNAKLAALISAAALLVAACGDEPDENGDDETGADETEDPSDDEEMAESDFLACMVTDEGGVDDQSFNQSAAEGLDAAQSAGVIGDSSVVESNAAADYAPNLDNLVAEDCGIIVTVGFLLAGDTAESANTNPDERYAIVDYLYTDFDEVAPENDNVKPLVFNTHEAAFLAGYVAAGYSTTGKVGTWGGLQIPTVTIFMDGFADGVAHYNEVHGTEVEVVGWDKETGEGEFVGDFSNAALALQISENMIEEGVDVIMPVAGPLGAQAATAAQDAGDVAVIWVDTDGTVSAPEYTDVLLTSVMKGITVAVEDAATTTANGEFSNEPFIGTLENGGVGIAPYHEFEDDLSDELKSEVEELRQQIIDGELEVMSDAAFG
jgi:basic membrane protein A